MKIILFAFLGLALISIGLLQNSYAFWPFDDTQQSNPNIIKIRQQDSIITYDKSTNKGSWQSAPNWLYSYTDYQGNPVYTPYNIWHGTNYVTIENAQASITANTDSCTIKVFDGDRVKTDTKPLLNSISFDLQQATNGTDIWSESYANSEKCNVSFTKDTNGVTAYLVQGDTISKDIELKLYDDSIPELILKVKNNGLDDTQKYGFAVSITNSSNIIQDGDIIKFQDSSNKTILTFDTQNSINHYLWIVKKTDTGLILDYKNAQGPLLSGQTLEIDPTFTANPSPNVYRFLTAAGAVSCSTYSSTTTSATQMQSFDLHGSSNGCGNSAAEFDITSFPRTAIVNSVQLAGSLGSSGATCSFSTEPLRPSTTAGATMYAQIQTATPYITGVSCNVGTTKINLGTNAINNFTASYSNNWFAVAMPFTGAYTSTVGSTQLLVNYTLPVPNAVTNVSCSPTQALGNTCTWNNATSQGGKVQGFYVTRNGTNEPLYSSNLVGYWKFDGLSLSNKINDYSTNKNNATVVGTYQNTTGVISNSEIDSNNSTYFTVGSISALNPTSIALTGWVKLPATRTGEGEQDVIRKDLQFIFRVDPNSESPNRVSFFVYTQDNCAVIHDRLSYTYTPNSWTFLVAQYNKNTGAWQLYANGTLIQSQIISTSGICSTANNLLIGSAGSTTTIIQNGGKYDDVRYYNRALSQSEITTLYNYRLNTPLSKLDTYLLKDGHTYNYCIYPVNQYGQNDTSSCGTSTAKNYAPPPNQLNGKFYKDGSNHYNVQLNWAKPSQFLGDNYLATGYKLQKLVGSTWTNVFTNSTVTTYTDSTLQNTTTQKYRLFSNNHLGTSPGYSFVNTNGTGLKTFYQFDNNTLDSRGSNTVTMTRDDNYTSGFIGYALALNGTQYAKSTATGVPNGTSDRTFSLWIKPSSFSTNSNAYLSTGSSSANAQFSIIDANGKIDCGGAGNNVNSTTTLTANHWALITCVLSNTGQTRSIYINGTLDKTSTTTAINSAATSLYIGTRADNTNRNVTSLIDNVRIYNTALNSTYVSELYNQAITSKDNSNIAGTHTLSFVTVGDVTRATSYLTITTGFPPPTITNWHLYNASVIYNSTNVSTPVVSNVQTSFLYGNYFNVDILHNFKAVARVSNGTTSTLINSTVYPIQYNYLPTYTTTSGVMWNYTITRPAPATNMSLLANENPILFTMNCQIQTASDAAAGKGNGWYNQSNTGYFLQSLSVHNYDNMYGTCWTPTNIKLFTFVSYGNSSLFPAINFMNTSYGAYIGVPVGVVFIVMAAALGNRRTAPMWVVIILAMAGIMATVGFFTLNAGVWALALIAGLLCLFVGRKIL